MLPGAPGLTRAVADCTQPYGSFVSGDGLRSLQLYLTDERSIDAVFRALLARAWVEPLSVAVVHKVVAVLKQLLLSYIPSPDVITSLEEFCERIPEAIQLDGTASRSLTYIRSLVRRASGMDSIRLKYGTARTPGQKSVVSSSTETPPSRATDETPPKASIPSSLASSLEQLPDRATNGSSKLEPVATSSPQWLKSIAEEALCIEPNTIPSWSVDSALPWRTEAPTGGAPGPPGRWAAAVPELSPHLCAHLNSETSTSSSEPINWSLISHYVLDVDDVELPRHMGEILQRMRQEATLEPASSLQPQKPTRQRALFHHQPYSLQERLNLPEADTSVVLEVVCGHAAAITTSATMDEPFVDSMERVWEDLFDADEAFGQVCGSILVKLVIDMWLVSGSGNSFVLLLRTLRKVLACNKAEVRCRAFDLLFNLALHSSMLVPDLTNSTSLSVLAHVRPPWSPAPQSPSPAASLWAGGKGDLELPTQSLHSPNEGVKEAEVRQPVTSSFLEWLRALVGQLLVDLTESHESSSDVWESALGALTALTSHAGHWVAAWVGRLPPAGLRGLLQAALDHSWSPKVYAQLIALMAAIATKEEAGAEANAEAWDAAEGSSRLAQWGGVAEVVQHLQRAPTDAARADVAAVLLHHLLPPDVPQTTRSALLTALVREGAVSALTSLATGPSADLAARLLASLSSSPSFLNHPCLLALSPFFTSFLRECLLSVQISMTSEIAANMRITMEHIKGGAEQVPGAGKAGSTAAQSDALKNAWSSLFDVCAAAHRYPSQRTLAVHWLHAILDQALVEAKGQLMSLSPLHLRTAGTGGQAPHGFLTLGKTLLSIARDVPGGAGLICRAALAALVDVRAGAVPHEGPRNLARLWVTALHVTVMWALQAQQADDSFQWMAHLSDVLLTALCELPLLLPLTVDEQHIAAAIVTGNASFNTQILSETPPELLITLLQQCSLQPSYSSLSRNTCGSPVSASTSEPLPTPWHDTHLDRRLALLMALVTRCGLDPACFARYSLVGVLRDQLTSEDVRARFVASQYLLKHWSVNSAERYWRQMGSLVVTAQQMDDERLLDNPFLQVLAMLEGSMEGS